MHISEVIHFIREQMTAYQLVDLEISDDQIEEIIKKPLLALLDQYIPAIKIYKPHPKHILKGTYTCIVNIPDEVVNVLQVLPDIAFGFMQLQTNPMFITQNTLLTIYNNIQSKLTNYSTMLNITWQFIPPNQLYVFNCYSDFAVVYIVKHSPDLTSVNEAFRWTVYKAALAIFKRAIGTARRKYATFNTPFGQIEIDYQLREEGIQELQQIEEELKSLPPPLPVVLF